MNPDRITIRSMRPGERERVEALVRRSFTEYERIMRPEAWAGLRQAVDAGLETAASADIIVADGDGELRGCVFLFPPAGGSYGFEAAESDVPEIRLLSVPPEARGLGVARALVEECIRRARERGDRAIGLHTSASMRAASALYSSMGFERRPELDFRPPGAELVEGYRLDLG